MFHVKQKFIYQDKLLVLIYRQAMCSLETMAILICGLYQNKYVAKKPQGVLEASNCKALRLRAKERS
jgi:hypothetical protein